MALMRRRDSSSSSRGTAVVYLVIVMLVLIITCSLAVDYGRVQLAKSELQQAADAAALAAGLAAASVAGLFAGVQLSDRAIVNGTATSAQVSSSATLNLEPSLDLEGT